jgi:hypothetical protein
MQRTFLLVFIIGLLALGGCATKTYQMEQSQLRTTIIDLQTEQLQDNLTRAYERQPFIHVAYKQMTGSVAIETSGQLSSASTNPPTDGITRVLTLMFGGKVSNSIQVLSSPVIDNDSVYKAYVDFADNPTYFGCADDDQHLDPKKIHLNWKRGKKTYYVKNEGKDAFLDLIIQTTVSVKTIEVDKKLVRKIIEAREVSGTDGYETVAGKNQHFLLLTFDSSVNNLDGSLSVKFDTNLERVFEVQPFSNTALNKKTTHLVLFYSTKNDFLGHNIEPNVLMSKLIGASVVLELRGLKGERIPVEDLTPNLRIQREQLEELRARPLIQ